LEFEHENAVVVFSTDFQCNGREQPQVIARRIKSMQWLEDDVVFMEGDEDVEISSLIQEANYEFIYFPAESKKITNTSQVAKRYDYTLEDLNWNYDEDSNSPMITYLRQTPTLDLKLGTYADFRLGIRAEFGTNK
jgi:hypothetical protein